MNNITFNLDGPSMTGTWYNHHTNDSFTVADTFFQDGQFLIKTTDGRLLDYNFIQNYVQADPKDIKQMKMVNPDPKQELPAEVASILDAADTHEGMLIEDLDIIQGNKRQEPIGNIFKPTQELDLDEMMIEKVLSKKTRPNIIIDIEWDRCPVKSFETLNDLLSVDIDKIAQWYINNISIQHVKDIIEESIMNYINSKLDVEMVSQEDVQVETPKPKKAKVQKTNKKKK